MTNLNSILKSRHYFANQGLSSQSYGFSSSHVWMRELDPKEYWALKNWCFWTMVLEKTLESPLDSKEIQPVHPKGNQSWIFIGRTDAEAETPVLWPFDAKKCFIGKIEGGRRRGWLRLRWNLCGRSIDWICMSLFLWCLFCFIDLYVFFMLVLYCFDREGNGDPFQYSCLRNPTDREAWQATVHGVAESWTGLFNWTVVLKIVIL